MSEIIVNKIAESGLITLDMQNLMPQPSSIRGFDIKPFLFKEMILREKDFRTEITAHDWTQYQDAIVAVFCSVEAIIPMWAYMIISSALQPYAKAIYYGTEGFASEQYFLQQLNDIDAQEYLDKRVVVKGCGDVAVTASAFLAITQKLKPVVKSLMYGEPCSTVPVYKKK